MHNASDSESIPTRGQDVNRIGTHYTASSAGELKGPGRVVLHEALTLTGSEISINELPAGATIPFVHRHKRNEEVYIILEGHGRFHVDGDEFEVGEGTVVRVDPAGARCLKAGDQDAMRYICVQTEAKSLVQFTENDGVALESKPTWLT